MNHSGKKPVAKSLTRRRLVKVGFSIPAILLFDRAFARNAVTPSCEEASTTRGMTAGPFYTPESPQKSDLRADDPRGEPVELVAEILDSRCRPIPGAVLDLWHADSAGRYDTDGFRLRGRQAVDADGVVRFRTIFPGRYGWRTPHFHVRLFGADGRRLLTTQLYFPGEAANERDGLFRSELLLNVEKVASELEARFTFIVDPA